VVAARILVEQLEMNTPQATARLCVTGHLTRQVGLAVSHAVGRPCRCEGNLPIRPW
jgi:hypothetical protein